jgi:hypothetical protein
MPTKHANERGPISAPKAFGVRVFRACRAVACEGWVFSGQNKVILGEAFPGAEIRGKDAANGMLEACAPHRWRLRQRWNEAPSAMLEQIRRFLRAAPFVPFQIHTSAGEVLSVEHPENCAIVAHTVVVALPDGENAIMLSPLHISGVAGAQPAGY